MEIKSSAKSVSGFGSQGPGQNKVAGAIGGILQKIKKKEGAKNGDPDNEIEKQEKCAIFESKHVKDVIETFNNVLQVVEQYEEELNEFVNEEDGFSEDEEEDTAATSGLQAPKVVKASLSSKLSSSFSK